MKLTHQSITQIAEALVLKNTVFIHKKKGCFTIIPIPSTSPIQEDKEAIQQILQSENAYLRIEHPAKDASFIQWAYSNFLSGVEKTRDEEIDLEITVDVYEETGDGRPFLRQVEKMGKVQQWLDHERKYYERYIKDCIYPYNEQLIFVQ